MESNDIILSSLRSEAINHVSDIDLIQVRQFSSTIHRALKNNNTVYIFGNGASASLADHFASDLIFIFRSQEKKTSARVFSLASNKNLITAQSNDYGYDTIFSGELQAAALNRGDVTIGISTSGRSKNVLKALAFAIEVGAIRLGITGAVDIEMSKMCHQCFVVNSRNQYVVEGTHFWFIQLVEAALRYDLEVPQPIL